MRLLLFIIILLVSSFSANSQALVTTGTTTPIGACTTGIITYINVATGEYYDCFNSVWRLTSNITNVNNLVNVNLINQGAAIVATNLYSVPATGAGIYRVYYVAKISRTATTSSVLGGTSLGFQVLYTDNDDSTVNVQSPIGVTATGNSLTTQISGVLVVYAKASTNIQYKIGYTSVGATTMNYNLHIRIEAF